MFEDNESNPNVSLMTNDKIVLDPLPCVPEERLIHSPKTLSKTTANLCKHTEHPQSAIIHLSHMKDLLQSKVTIEIIFSCHFDVVSLLVDVSNSVPTLL